MLTKPESHFVKKIDTLEESYRQAVAICEVWMGKSEKQRVEIKELKAQIKVLKIENEQFEMAQREI